MGRAGRQVHRQDLLLEPAHERHLLEPSEEEEEEEEEEETSSQLFTSWSTCWVYGFVL